MMVIVVVFWYQVARGAQERRNEIWDGVEMRKEEEEVLLVAHVACPCQKSELVLREREQLVRQVRLEQALVQQEEGELGFHLRDPMRLQRVCLEALK